MKRMFGPGQITFIILLLTGHCLLGQNLGPVFHHLNKEKGFRQSVVNGLLRDKRGFVWMACSSGLFRYDGNSFTDITQQSPELKGHNITQVLEDRDGNIWVSTNDLQLGRFDIVTRTFQLFDLEKFRKQNAVQNGIKLFYIDEFNRLWIAGGGLGLFVYDPGRQSLTTVFDINQGYSLFIDKQNILASTFIRFSSYDSTISCGSLNDRLVIEWQPPKKLHTQFKGELFMSSPSDVWYLDKDKLFHYNISNGRTNSFDYYGEPIRDSELGSVFKLQPGSNVIWFNASGIYGFDTKAERFVARMQHSNSDAGSVTEWAMPEWIDDDNVLWLRAWGKGIDYCHLNSFRFDHLLRLPEQEKEQLGNFIRAMQVDENSVYATTQQQSTMLVLDKRTHETQTIKVEVGVHAFECMMKDKNGKIWAGGQRLFCYDPATKRAKTYEPPTRAKVFIAMSILQLRDGRILVGDYDSIRIFNEHTGVFKTLKGFQSADNANFSRLYEMPDGTLLVGQYDKGLRLYKPNADDFTLVKTLHKNLHVKCIIPDSDSNLLMATTTGLYSYHIKKQEIRPVTVVNLQMPDPYLYAVQKTANGFYWASSNAGIYRWKTNYTDFMHFGKEFGVQDMEFNTNAYCSDSEGNIYFGGVNGINVISKQLNVDFTPPKTSLQLTSLNADSLHYLYPDKHQKYTAIKLPPGNSAIEIDYIIVDYFDKDAHKVVYRLKGYDDKWITGQGIDKARFLNVRPGNYRFEIMQWRNGKAMLGTLQWIDVYFTPYWWQTWWFKITLLIGFATAIFYAIKSLLDRKLKRQKAELEKQYAVQLERERIMADLHDDVGATLSSMHMYGDLAENVWDRQPEESRVLVEKISLTSKELMNRMGDIIWSMKPVGDDKYTLEARLKNYCSELLSQKNINFDCRIDAAVEKIITQPDARKNMLLIAKEAINNAAKYSDASCVFVTISVQNEQLCFSVSDNGRGFDEQMNKTGNGIKNMIKRTELLGGVFEINSTVGSGTTIQCKFSIATFSYK